ncbi:hypothetical protein WJX79_001137 [Trebouxia sp. C0005]
MTSEFANNRSSFCRAAEICTLLQEQRPELEIKLNPSKPRKGCFEVQDQSGKIYVSLLNMPRPFKQLRELDIVKVADDMAANMTTAKEGISSPSECVPLAAVAKSRSHI